MTQVSFVEAASVLPHAPVFPSVNWGEPTNEGFAAPDEPLDYLEKLTQQMNSCIDAARLEAQDAWLQGQSYHADPTAKQQLLDAWDRFYAKVREISSAFNPPEKFFQIAERIARAIDKRLVTSSIGYEVHSTRGGRTPVASYVPPNQLKSTAFGDFPDYFLRLEKECHATLEAFLVEEPPKTGDEFASRIYKSTKLNEELEGWRKQFRSLRFTVEDAKGVGLSIRGKYEIELNQQEKSVLATSLLPMLETMQRLAIQSKDGLLKQIEEAQKAFPPRATSVETQTLWNETFQTFRKSVEVFSRNAPSFLREHIQLLKTNLAQYPEYSLSDYYVQFKAKEQNPKVKEPTSNPHIAQFNETKDGELCITNYGLGITYDPLNFRLNEITNVLWGFPQNLGDNDDKMAAYHQLRDLVKDTHQYWEKPIDAMTNIAWNIKKAQRTSLVLAATYHLDPKPTGQR